MATTGNPLQQTIEAVAKEKGLDPNIVISAIEEAVAAASRKYYKGDERLKTRFNPETGQVELYAVKQVVETVTNPAAEISLEEARELYRQSYGEEVAQSIEVGDEMELPRSTEVLGRIAAQLAKQVIFQKVREAERENIYNEYSQRVGEVDTWTVKRFESGDIIAERGRVEAILPRKEQSRAESYVPGDRVRAIIKAVNKNAKGPQIVLSRTDPALLIKLFEQEVPEIYDGTVVIRGAVREAGDRAKVAVYSRDRDVDPVGACVGMKGTRVQAIIRELRGEKIDIVEWSEDPVVFVTNALSPARVQRVSIVDDANKIMEVVVEDKQLSLAIGKKGQNVRLAAKLTGWKIDIKSEEEKRREVERQLEGLGAPPSLSLPGIHDEVVHALRQHGFDTLDRVLAASPEELAAVPGLDAETAELVLAAAREEAAARAQAAPAALFEAPAVASLESTAEQAIEAEWVEIEPHETAALETGGEAGERKALAADTGGGAAEPDRPEESHGE
ncbi:MAG TPA: transcription termination factor NusA [Vicinamibacterales bacterium]|nr:transcription termination factor NusA [Vicinamibacterales bacterium]